MGQRTWSSERTARLGELATLTRASATGIARELSKQFGIAVTRSAVIGKASRMRLELPGAHGRLVERVNPPPRPPRPPKQRTRPMPATPEPRIRFLDLGDENCTLAELHEDSCRWPLGDPRDPDFRYCGRAKVKDRPYCKHHLRRAYVDGGKR